MEKRSRIFVLAIVLAFFAAGLVTAAPAGEHMLVRQTKYGAVRGQISNAGSVEWLGVAYAKPPVGSLRWRAPADPEAWSGVRDTVKIGPASIQMSGGKVSGSEDCLYLNVYRPESLSVNLPVLVFLHGGNNQTGAGSSFDGNLFASTTNSVVVTVNSRLNAFGFLSIDAIKTGDPLEDSGNFGLLDIRKSLDWVEDNIKAFGGNPDNVTVMGFSSGGRNTLCMTISPIFKEKFHKVITLCGGMTTMDPKEGSVIATKAIASLVVEDKIRPDEASAIEWINSAVPEVKQYLMGVSAERYAKLMANANIRMTVFPHLFADGYVIPKEGFDVLKTGNYNKVPMIFSSGRNEFKSKANDDAYFKDLNASVDNPERAREYEFTTKYGDMLFGWLNAENNAASYSAVPGQPAVYTSRVMWGSDPAIVGTRGAILVGGGHGMDFYLILNQEPGAYTVSDEIFSAANRQGRHDLGSDMRQYFARFMRTGDPNNAAGLPYGKTLVKWDSWTNSAPKMMLFDADKQQAKISMTSDYWKEEDIFRQILDDTTLSPEKRDFQVSNILNARFFSKNLDAFWADQKK